MPIIVERFLQVLFLIVIVAIAVLVTCILSITGTHAALVLDAQPHAALQAIADMTLAVFRARPEHGSPQYLDSLLAMQNMLTVIATGTFAAAPALTVFTVLFGWKRRLSVKVHKITRPGKDDLAIMLRYYIGAEHVTLYSGDFSWLQEQGAPELALKLVRELGRLATAKKLRLISHKSEEEVRRGMGTAFPTFETCLRYDDPKGLKCSVVRYGEHSWAFLTKSHAAAPEGREVTVTVFTDARETRSVLNTLALLLGSK